MTRPVQHYNETATECTMALQTAHHTAAACALCAFGLPVLVLVVVVVSLVLVIVVVVVLVLMDLSSDSNPNAQSAHAAAVWWAVCRAMVHSVAVSL